MDRESLRDNGPRSRLGKTARFADNFGRLTAPHRTMLMVFRY